MRAFPILLLSPALIASGCGKPATPKPADPAEPPAGVAGRAPLPIPVTEPPSQPPPPEPHPPDASPTPPQAAPPPALSPALPPAALDAHALLEEWRSRARQDLRDAALELALGQSYLLENQPLRAHELLKEIDPKTLPSDEARQSWRLASAEACERLGAFERAHDLLQEGQAALRPLTPLRISGECFSVDSRRRVPVASPDFAANQTVTVYFDLDRLGSVGGEAGHVSKVRFDLTLLEPSGRLVSDFADWEAGSGMIEEPSHKAWEDHAYRLTFRLPAKLNLGAYLLKVEAADLSASPPRKASATLPLSIR